MNRTMNKFISLLIIITMAACNDDPNGKDNGKTGDGGTTSSFPPPANISYSIIKTYPHDTASFTQGLVFYKGELYENTGEYGHSRLLKVNLQTGKAIREMKLADEYFGEGITIINDTIYQLTWMEHKVFVYTVNDFKKIKEFDLPTEGWGITYDGSNLIVSVGSNRLYFYDPSDFKLVRTIDVFEGATPVPNLNELEFIDGFIYANQWQYPYILKIDPATGQVVGKSNLTDLWNKVKAKDSNIDVPNGIAYDSTSGKLYITGKKWPELYEIKLAQ